MAKSQLSLQLLLLYLVCYFTPCSKVKGHSAKKSHPLLVIAFDGFRWDYLKKTDTPNFDKIINQGVHAREGIKNVFITQTNPNFWTLATGLYPESHGVISNKMYDPVIKEIYIPFSPHGDKHTFPNDRRFFDAGGEPIWVTNQRQNSHHRSGIVMWPGARYSIKWARPTIHMPYDSGVSEIERADAVLGWFTQDNPINLGMIYFDDPDLIAHKNGPDSEKVTEYIKKADDIVGHILSVLKQKNLLDDMNIIITSDHGMTSISRSQLIYFDDIIPHDWVAMTPTISPALSIFPKQGMEERIYSKLKEASMKPDSHFVVWKKKDIPERFHYKHNIRVAPIMALADLHYSFLVNKPIERFTSAGNHGYDNEFQEMHPIFLAMGPSFKKDYSVKTFDNVDVYPLMCHLLDLDPAPNNGSMFIVSQGLSSHETTNWTFATYIFLLIFIGSIGGIFIVATCRQHRYLKRKMFQNRQVGVQGGIQYSVPAKGNAVIKLLSDGDDDDDDDDDFGDNNSLLMNKGSTP